MNITIKLTTAQVKGIKDYIKDTTNCDKPSKKEVASEIAGILASTLYAYQEAISDYIKKAEEEEGFPSYEIVHIKH
jgi:hypothetical protein